MKKMLVLVISVIGMMIMTSLFCGCSTVSNKFARAPVQKKKSPANLWQTSKTSHAKTASSKTPKLKEAALQWQWPADGLIQAQPSSLEIVGRSGTPIKAASNGIVLYSGHGLKQYGNLIIVKHNEDFVSVYAHNKALKVKEGDKVVKGQTIALMGKSGAERVKLHFEIRAQGKAQDPLKFLPKI